MGTTRFVTIASALFSTYVLLLHASGPAEEVQYSLKIHRRGWTRASGPSNQSKEEHGTLDVTQGGEGLRLVFEARFGVYEAGMVALTDNEGQSVVVDPKHKEYWVLTTFETATNEGSSSVEVGISATPMKSAAMVGQVPCDRFEYDIRLMPLTVPSIRDIVADDVLRLGHGSACLWRESFDSIESSKTDVLFLIFAMPATIMNRIPVYQQLAVGSAVAVAEVSGLRVQSRSARAAFQPPPGFRRISPPLMPRESGG